MTGTLVSTTLRVLVDEFQPSRSQRRVLKRWRALGDSVKIEVARPTIDDEKLDLFHRHKRERGLAEADDEIMDAAGYTGWLVRSCLPTVEMRYRIDDRLVAVGILDLGATASSSVYFYFDPDFAQYSPGTWSALFEIEMAAQWGLDHYYLGYYIPGCDAMNYKARFQPCEMKGPDDPYWRPAPAPGSQSGTS